MHTHTHSVRINHKPCGGEWRGGGVLTIHLAIQYCAVLLTTHEMHATPRTYTRVFVEKCRAGCPICSSKFRAWKSRLPSGLRRGLIFTIHLHILAQRRYMPAPPGMIKAGAAEPAFLKPNILAGDEAAGVGARGKASLCSPVPLSLAPSLNQHVYTSVRNAVVLSHSATNKSLLFAFFFFFLLTHLYFFKHSLSQC